MLPWEIPPLFSVSLGNVIAATGKEIIQTPPSHFPTFVIVLAYNPLSSSLLTLIPTMQAYWSFFFFFCLLLPSSLRGEFQQLERYLKRDYAINSASICLLAHPHVFTTRFQYFSQKRRAAEEHGQSVHESCHLLQQRETFRAVEAKLAIQRRYA